MKVLYSWLKDFVPMEINAVEAAELLSRLGFEIASLQHFGGKIENIVVGLVKDVQKHPNADRLSLCQVTDGQRDYSVVCGAANVKTGIRIPLAKVGATLPNGDVLKAAKIRGIDSQGMICSAAELALEEKSDGILILKEDAPLGEDIRQVLGLDDTLIEIETTPNRRDVLSVLGVARELAAGLSLPLKNLEPRVRELEIMEGVTLANEAPELCPRYIARAIRDVKVGPSPEWMARRLSRCGIRSINNIVDITNYVMLELGQPMHAFDMSRLKGRQIRVRTARLGEKLVTLEGKTAELAAGMLIIADEERPVALAGIMGGDYSGITEETRDIVLESAAFSPSHVRQVSKALGISSDSSYRFERGTDWTMVGFASKRAAQLIQELAGGLGFKPQEASTTSPSTVSIKLRMDRMRQFLGADFKESQAADLLRRLGCVINTGTAQLLVTVPSWRLDLTLDADLMEDIARLHGYDQLPTRMPAVRPTTVIEDPYWTFERRLAGLLTGLGLHEASNDSFLSEKRAEPFTPGFGQPADATPVAIANPLSLEQAVLRSSMLPNLLQNVLLNFHRQVSGLRLFETGRIFFQDQDGRQERRRLGIVLAGQTLSKHWRQKSRTADYVELVGILESLLGALHITPFQWTPLRATAFHPKRAASLLSGNTPLAWIGELHPSLKDQLDLKETVLAAEIDIAALYEKAPRSLRYQAPSAFPPVHRDLSVIAPEGTVYEKLERTVRSAAGAALESLDLIDLFQGEKIGVGKRSLTMSLVFRNPERTLSDAEVEKAMQKIIKDLQTRCDAVLRT